MRCAVPGVGYDTIIYVVSIFINMFTCVHVLRQVRGAQSQPHDVNAIARTKRRDKSGYVVTSSSRCASRSCDAVLPYAVKHNAFSNRCAIEDRYRYAAHRELHSRIRLSTERHCPSDNAVIRFGDNGRRFAFLCIRVSSHVRMPFGIAVRRSNIIVNFPTVFVIYTLKLKPSRRLCSFL